jgi:excisionase family DNA binding protein
MKLLNTNQAAEKLGISARRVRAMIAAGTLRAHHIGQEWAIEESVLAHVTVYGKPGRPPVGKKAKKAKPQTINHKEK